MHNMSQSSRSVTTCIKTENLVVWFSGALRCVPGRKAIIDDLRKTTAAVHQSGKGYNNYLFIDVSEDHTFVI